MHPPGAGKFTSLRVLCKKLYQLKLSAKALFRCRFIRPINALAIRLRSADQQTQRSASAVPPSHISCDLVSWFRTFRLTVSGVMSYLLFGVFGWTCVHWVRRSSAKSLAGASLLGSLALATAAVVDVLYTRTFSTLAMMMIGFAGLGIRRYWSVFRSGTIRLDQTRRAPSWTDGKR